MPRGTAIKELIKTAENETFKEVITTLKSAASKLKIKLKDEIKAPKKNPSLVDSKTIYSRIKTPFGIRGILYPLYIGKRS